MKEQAIANVEAVIDFIENHLNEKLELSTVADAIHYSKYYLHRMFSDTVGMTIHNYIVRRQLTEAARQLVFSDRSIIEIAFLSGYESQQAFTAAFKCMYKMPPARYRARRRFYPLQLRFTLHKRTAGDKDYGKWNICPAEIKDVPAWIDLMHLVIDGYPCLDEAVYQEKLMAHIRKNQAFILKEGNLAVGIMAFSYKTGNMEFMGIHPQYRSLNVRNILLDALTEEYLPGREISTTTYRVQDKADTGYRTELKQLGFVEKELLVEFGYPTQRFVLPPKI